MSDSSPRRGRRWTTVFVLGCAVVFAFLVGLTRIANYDVWWHLATGRTIWEVGIPDTDPFSYSQSSQPAELQSWAADLLYYLVTRLSGLEGLTVLKGLLGAVILWLLVARARLREEARLTAVVVAVVAVAFLGLKFRLLMRPLLLGYVLLAGMLLVLEAHRWRARILLPVLGVLQLAWVNMHGSFVLGLILPPVLWAGDLLDHRLRKTRFDVRQSGRTAALLMAVLLVATMLSPAGFETGAWLGKALQRGEYKTLAGEWQPLTPALLTSFGLRYTWGFSATALLGIGGLAIAAYRRQLPPARDVLIFVLFLGLPFVSGVRFIGEFLVVTSPLVAVWWCKLLAPFAERHASRWLPGIEVATGMALAPLFWWAVLDNPVLELGLGEKESKFPGRAVAVLDRVAPKSLVFNSLGFGGYLMWKSPGRKVFIDGRELLYPPSFFSDYRAAYADPLAWEALQQRYGCNAVLLEYLTDFAGKERMAHLDGDPDWALVFWDPVARLYLRRGSPHDEVIDRMELRWARPAHYDVSQLRQVIARGGRDAALAEYRRLVQDSTLNAEAYQGIAFLAAAGPTPAWDQVLEASSEVLRLEPAVQQAGKLHALRALALLQTGRLPEARDAVEEAARLAPFDDLVVETSRRIYAGER